MSAERLVSAVIEQAHRSADGASEARFSKLKRQPKSEIITKFDNVKSRISWIAERLQCLQQMWMRGDRAADIATALGCKVGAVNVARARFGCRPSARTGRANTQDRTSRVHHLSTHGILHREGAGRTDGPFILRVAARRHQRAGRQRHRCLRGSRHRAGSQGRDHDRQVRKTDTYHRRGQRSRDSARDHRRHH
jgi:hypothetical protein